MFTRNVPKFYWWDVILTTTYLINQMPSKVLSWYSSQKIIMCLSHITSWIRSSSFYVWVHDLFSHPLKPETWTLCYEVYISWVFSYWKGIQMFWPCFRAHFCKPWCHFLWDTPFYHNSSIQGGACVNLRLENMNLQERVPLEHWIVPIEPLPPPSPLPKSSSSLTSSSLVPIIEENSRGGGDVEKQQNEDLLVSH